MQIKFLDLKRQYDKYWKELREASNNVLQSGNYIGNLNDEKSEVSKLARAIEKYTGAAHIIPCGSGTDALMAVYIDLIYNSGIVNQNSGFIFPDFNFISAIEAFCLVNKNNNKYYLLPVNYEDYMLHFVSMLIEQKHIARFFVTVTDMFGQIANYNKIRSIIEGNGKRAYLIEDACQSFGAEHKGKKAGMFGDIAVTSFYPAKPFGGFGEGGAIIIPKENIELYNRLKAIINHGCEKTYEHKYIGFNGRMDEMQAALLNVKIRHLDEELVERRRIAGYYIKELPKEIIPIQVTDKPSWAQFTIRLPYDIRDKFKNELEILGIPTCIHYPKLNSQQEYLKSIECNSQSICGCVLSLPINPWLKIEEVCDIIEGVNKTYEKLVKEEM
jgi:UDP-2-acetamido-2-deoxy-ribo-hexuluronate aminotransferase